mgnify:FL=1
MPTVHEIEEFLYELAPRDLAMEWDNVGLLVGDPDLPIRRALVALDVTEETAREAARSGFDLIVAHHPVMNLHWHQRELNTLRPDTRLGKLLIFLVKSGVAAICMHTNLDAAPGGVNDALAQVLGLTAAGPLGDDGIGRVGELPGELTTEELLKLVKDRLQPNGIRYADAKRPIRRLAVGGGACGDYFRAAVERGCDAFVTSDVKYDQFLDARALGLTLVDAGHFPTENVICPILVRKLRERFPDLTVELSHVHREVIQYVK